MDLLARIKQFAERNAAEYHRQLGQIEAKRINDLLEANAVLKRLATVGQDITASLNVTDVFAALDRHIHILLDAFSIVIYQLNTEKTELVMAFGLEDNSPVPNHQIQVSDVLSNAAWCARN